jgi:hypothetical protein
MHFLGNQNKPPAITKSLASLSVLVKVTAQELCEAVCHKYQCLVEISRLYPSRKQAFNRRLYLL